ncbi:MAG: hypothetical protein EON96_07505 [Caulobacteraceae bacterium]|nr:MAG: hypothetical protein EON96_07505 [Caulobacteraceae bacterium]
MLATGLAVTTLGGCDHALARKLKQYCFRLKMGLIIDGEARTIESVRRSESWSHYSWVPAANRSFSRLIGSATPVDIGARTLFLTMAGYQQYNGSRMSHYGDGPRAPTGTWTPYSVYGDRGVEDAPDWSGGDKSFVLEVEPHELPVLATFTDASDPRSIVLVRPEALATFFPGVRFGRSTVEWTRSAVTRTDIRRRLPWAYDNKGKPEIYPYVEAGRYFFGG